MRNVFLVGFGGFFGAAARYLCTSLTGKLYAGSFPLGTFLVNVLGAFLIGFLSELLASACPKNKSLSLFLTTGILGGFTTFSTFSLETVDLWRDGKLFFAGSSLALSVAFGILGVILGRMTAAAAVR